ncbi:MAG: hypothetical protein H6Q11_767 [Acidobacteria bacterium]|nr:hypothetical protein [Acidobacteriota bacterium]
MTLGEALTIGVAAVALAVAAFLAVQVRRLERRMAVLPEDGGVFEALRRLDADLASAEEAIAALRPVVQSLHERMPGALRYAAMVAYDATGDLAGNLSRSIALLNERGDGLVLTLLTRRSESLFYTKMVRGGRGTEALSPEEQEVVDRALGS